MGIDSQTIPEFDDICYWLELPEDHKDYHNKPKQSPNCKSNCGNKFERIFTKRLIRIANFSDYMGIDYFDFHDMCDECKRGVYVWYFNDVWFDHPEYKTAFEDFEFQIEENYAASSMNEAYRKYQKMVEEYHTDNVSGLTKDELEDYRKYYKNCEKWWDESRRKINEKSKEDEAIKRGYQIE